MSRKPDSGKIDLAEVFRRVQTEMIAHLSVSNLFEHGPTQGTTSEQEWMQLLNLYLPTRYRSAPVFVVNADGGRSRQIDLAIFDTFSSPQLFRRPSALYVPVESVYATFEIKSVLTGLTLRDAGAKAASVRQLRSETARPILAGILAPTSPWSRYLFSPTLARDLERLPDLHKLDLGCVLDRASFESAERLVVSRKNEALIFFLLRLVERLDALGPAPRVDLMRYARSVRSLKPCQPTEPRA